METWSTSCKTYDDLKWAEELKEGNKVIERITITKEFA
jgi:hypothetical protein